jgi:hypothetical protein
MATTQMYCTNDHINGISNPRLEDMHLTKYNKASRALRASGRMGISQLYHQKSNDKWASPGIEPGPLAVSCTSPKQVSYL